MKFCIKDGREKAVSLFDCLACYFGNRPGERKGNSNCGFCITK